MPAVRGHARLCQQRIKCARTVTGGAGRNEIDNFQETLPLTIRNSLDAATTAGRRLAGGFFVYSLLGWLCCLGSAAFLLRTCNSATAGRAGGLSVPFHQAHILHFSSTCPH